MNKNKKWEKWRADLKDITWLKAIFFFTLFYISYPILETNYPSSSLDKLFSGFEINFPMGCALAFIPVILFGQKLLRLNDGLLPKPQRLIGIIVFFAIYFWHWRLSGLYEFNLITCSPIAWFDLLPLSLGLLFLKMKTYENLNGNLKGGLSYPEKEHDLVEDLYHRSTMAKNIGEVIGNSTNEEGATVIGLFSEWGSGKTDFLERLTLVLRGLKDGNGNQNNEILEFNPWKYSAGEVIIQSFFKEFERELRKYDDDIDSLLKAYTNEIMGNSRSLRLKFLQTLILNTFAHNSDLTVQQKIKNTLLSTGKRFIIYVDDIDRLTGREIIEVFKLVRVIADFPNVFFVVTMDYDYVIKTVERTNEIDNIEQYIKKIFDVSFRLPIVIKDTFTNQIIKLIERDFQDERKVKSQEILRKFNSKELFMERQEVFGLVEKMLQNTRDVLQFYNSLKGHLVNLNGEVELGDLILLELLKVYSFRTYNTLSLQDESLLIVEEGSYKIVSNGENSNEANKSIDPIVLKVLKRLVYSKGKSIGMFCNVINHYLYFSYTLPEDMISRKEFYDSLGKTDEGFLEIVEGWIKLKKKDIFFLMSKHSFVQDIDEYKNFLKAYLRFGKELGFKRLPKEVVDIKKYLDSFSISLEEQEELVTSLLMNQNFEINERMTFCEHLVHQFSDEKYRILREKELLLNLMRGVFREALYKADGLDIYGLLTKIDATPENRNRMVLDSTSAQLYVEFLQTNCKELGKYLQGVFHAVRLSPRDTHFTLEPFIVDIFDHPRILRGLLENCEFNENITNRLKDVFLSLNLDDYFLNTTVLVPGDENYDFLYKYFWAKERKEDPEGMSTIDALMNLPDKFIPPE